MLDLSQTLQGAGGVGGLLLVKTSQGTGIPLYDGNGNISGLADADTGTITARYDYGAFGETLGAWGPAANQPFGFSSKYQDSETKLVYYGFRYYNPSTGRWLSRDPIEEGDGPNMYALVSNGPVDFTDKLGLQISKPCSYAVGRCMRSITIPPLPESVTIRGKVITIPTARINTLLSDDAGHHDVKVAAYTGVKKTGTEIQSDTLVKGFFAKNFVDAGIKGFLSEVPGVNRFVSGWVDGEVRESSATAGQCSLTEVTETEYKRIKKKLENARFSSYHLRHFNCQKFADSVLK